VYSGTQLKETLDGLLMGTYTNFVGLHQLIQARRLKFYIGAPYITRASLMYEKIRSITLLDDKDNALLYQNVSLLPHEPMLLMQDRLIDKKEREEYERTRDQVTVPGYDRKGFTMFEHKLPDFFSVPPIFRGVTLENKSDICFIEEHQPVYRCNQPFS
jgi:hypothetical protein